MINCNWPIDSWVWYAIIFLATACLLIAIWMVKKKVYSDSMTRNMRRIVVFDLDETIGSFVEIGMFWDALRSVTGIEQDNVQMFYKVMDAFPEFLRPDIIRILEYVVDMRRKGKCWKIMIYTNNQGPRSWAQMIASYLSHKIGENVFDQIIAAFKVRGQRVEIGRTSHDKSVGDLMRCTNVPADTKICFIDDQYHSLMDDERVYYINAKPYSYSMQYAEMANKFHALDNMGMDRDEFAARIVRVMQRYHYTVFNKPPEEVRVDEVVSKGMLLHIEKFFRTSGGKITRKRRTAGRQTRKKHD